MFKYGRFTLKPNLSKAAKNYLLKPDRTLISRCVDKQKGRVMINAYFLYKQTIKEEKHEKSY